MAAFLAAKELGATAIEFDVHLSADGVPVVVHDFDLARTTDGEGVVFETSWADLDRLDAGLWFGDDFAGEGIPRLAEVLVLDGLDFELEIKGYSAGVVDAVLAAVDAAAVFGRVKFTGWNVTLLAEIKRRRPEAHIGHFSKQPEPWMTPAMYEHVVVGMAEFSVADIVHVHAEAVTESIIERLHELRKLVQANDAPSPQSAVRALELGADFVSANDVGGVVAALA